jgi:hypothetical protein
LDDLVGQQLIAPQLALKVLLNFDKAMSEELSKVKEKFTFRVSMLHPVMQN